MVRPIKSSPCRVPAPGGMPGSSYTHRLSQGPCRCSALGDARASRSRGGPRGGKPYNGLQDMAAFSAEGTPDGTAARSHGAICAPQMFTTTPAADAQPWVRSEEHTSELQ